MTRLFKDNVITELDIAINAVTLVFDVTPGDEALFPVLGAGDFYYVTFSDFPLETVWEIFRIDANPSGNTFTATSRGATNGPMGNLVWPGGTLISMRVLASEYAAFAVGGITLEDEGTPVPNGPHTVMNFLGAGVDATDAGSGEANITIPGGGGGAADFDLILTDGMSVLVGAEGNVLTL